MTTLTTYDHADLPALMSRMTGADKHSFAATSTLDVIWTLYDRVLRIDPRRPRDEDRDRFLLSKGHGPMAYYSVLAARGFFPVEWLDGFGSFDSPLGHHPDRTLIPGVEIGSGSLGHGLAMATGLALGLRLRGGDQHVFCLVGDAELDEGSNHEAIAIAGRKGLRNLTAIVIDNQSSSLGWPGGVERRFEIEGWSSTRISGRDHDAIGEALEATRQTGPAIVVAEVEARDA